MTTDHPDRTPDPTARELAAGALFGAALFLWCAFELLRAACVVGFGE
jgi:hypothetical protein